jgi:hypothetical protein
VRCCQCFSFRLAGAWGKPRLSSSLYMQPISGGLLSHPQYLSHPFPSIQQGSMVPESMRPDIAHPRMATKRQVIRSPVIWGVVWGVVQAVSPFVVWWLEPATVYALSLILIASVYIGFAVADGRPRVIAVESGVAAIFVFVAAAAISGSAWLVVIGLVAHGLKDLWQYRSHFVAGTRWWPPFCCAVDLVAAGLISIGILQGAV